VVIGVSDSFVEVAWENGVQKRMKPLEVYNKRWVVQTKE
jgi:hypothetical protein